MQINFSDFFNMCLFMCLHFDISSVLEFNKLLNFDFITISQRLSNISCDEIEFDEVRQEYQNKLTESGHK